MPEEHRSIFVVKDIIDRSICQVGMEGYKHVRVPSWLPPLITGLNENPSIALQLGVEEFIRFPSVRGEVAIRVITPRERRGDRTTSFLLPDKTYEELQALVGHRLVSRVATAIGEYYVDRKKIGLPTPSLSLESIVSKKKKRGRRRKAAPSEVDIDVS